MTFNPSIPGVDSTQLQYMKQIDLNDYYRDVLEQAITHCQICNTSIAKNDVFEHSISKRHKYNKLLFGIAQDRSQNLDADFIVLNIDRLQCRYCNSLTINSDDNDLVINHTQDIGHITKRQDSLDGDTTSAVNSSPLLKPLDTLIMYANDSKKLSKKSDKRVEVVEKLLEESKQSKNELKNMNNFDESSTLHLSESSRDFKSKEEIPKMSIIGDDGPCFRSFFCLSLTKGMEFVDVHPNCTNNRRPMIPVMKYIDQISQPLLFTSEDIQTPLAKPSLSETRTTVEEALNNEETDSNGQNSIPRYSPALDKKISQNEIELPDYISIDENDTVTCNLCVTMVLNSYQNIDLHVNGKKHKEAIEVEKLLIPDFISAVEKGKRKCTICLGNIANNSRSIGRHIDSEQHKKAALQLLQSTDKDLENKVPIEKKPLTKSGPPAFIAIQENGIHRCTLCRTGQALKGYNEIDQHVDSKKHEEAMRIHFKLPDCVSIVKDGIRCCTICNIKIPNVHSCIINHIMTSKAHKAAMQLSQSTSEELVTKAEKTTTIRAANNIDQHSPPQCSAASSDKKLQNGIALPSYVTIGKNGGYKCTPCGIEVPKTSVNITEHLNGKKHKQKMIEINECKLQKLKLKEIKTSLPVSVLSAAMPALPSLSKKLEIKRVVPDSREPEVTNEPTPEPVQISNSRKAEEITTAIGATNNIDQHSPLQCSAASSDKKLQNGIALPSYVTIGKNGGYKCTPCGIEVPRTSVNITEHLNGKKHKQKMIEINESKLQKLKLKEIKTSLPVSVLSAAMPALPSPSKKLEIKRVVPDSREPEVTNEPTPEPVQISNSRKAEEITTAIGATNNIDQHSPLQCSAASSDKKLQNGIALPSYVTIGKNGRYKCTPCGIEVPRTSVNITEHLNGKKHKQKVIEIYESKVQKIKLKEIKTSLPVSVLSAAMPALPSTSKELEIKGVVPDSSEPEVTNEPTPELVQFTNSRKTGEITTARKATDNIDQCSLPQLPSGTELPSCSSIGENGAYKCTPCGIKDSGISITDHINDEKHTEKIMEMNASESQKLKLKETETSLPVSVLPAEIPALPRTVKTDTYMCITCLISMPNDKVIMKEHNECPMHKQKNQDLKIDVLNTVYLNGNNSSNYICLIDHHIVCKLCRIFLPEHSLITEHVNSKEHKDNIPRTSEPRSSTNAENLKTDVLTKHVDSGLVHIVEIDDVRACKICRRVISTLPDVHVRTKKHQAMMQKVDERLIGYEEVEKLWVCKICEKIYPKSKEFTHVYSNKHIRKTEALS